MIREFGKAVALTAALVGAALAPSTARAGMIPTNVTVTPDGNNFRWTYAVVVTTDVNVKPGDSFTIYDFNGLVAGSVTAPDGWALNITKATPGRPGTNPNDNPLIDDFTFTYTGQQPIVGQAGLGNFWAISQYSKTETSDFTSSTHRQVDGRLENNITSTDVPMGNGVGPQNTPEPATLVMLAAGIPVLGAMRFLRLRKKK